MTDEVLIEEPVKKPKKKREPKVTPVVVEEPAVEVTEDVPAEVIVEEPKGEEEPSKEVNDIIEEPKVEEESAIEVIEEPVKAAKPALRILDGYSLIEEIDGDIYFSKFTKIYKLMSDEIVEILDTKNIVIKAFTRFNGAFYIASGINLYKLDPSGRVNTQYSHTLGAGAIIKLTHNDKTVIAVSDNGFIRLVHLNKTYTGNVSVFDAVSDLSFTYLAINGTDKRNILAFEHAAGRFIKVKITDLADHTACVSLVMKNLKLYVSRLSGNIYRLSDEGCDKIFRDKSKTTKLISYDDKIFKISGNSIIEVSDV